MANGLTVLFHQFLRPDMKFDNLESLKKQLQDDKAEAIKSLETINFAKP